VNQKWCHPNHGNNFVSSWSICTILSLLQTALNLVVQQQQLWICYQKVVHLTPSSSCSCNRVHTGRLLYKFCSFGHITLNTDLLWIPSNSVDAGVSLQPRRHLCHNQRAPIWHKQQMIILDVPYSHNKQRKTHAESRQSASSVHHITDS